VGTFYRSASPAADPFVGVGSRVERDKTVLCIIEAMKLMNEILADTSGVVAEIYVENGQAVEYGQPLFGIKN
jgi:acetyl-CoA carboxylase biotin carboxyl carrier protein